MHEEILCDAKVQSSKDKRAATTVICRIFGGYLCNVLKCEECHYCSETYEYFQDLSLDIDNR
jgi:ubiquitin C-terminal hydrolase